MCLRRWDWCTLDFTAYFVDFCLSSYLKNGEENCCSGIWGMIIQILKDRRNYTYRYLPTEDVRGSKTIVGKWRSHASKFNSFLLQNFKLSALLWPIYHFPSPPQCPGQDLGLAEDGYILCWLYLTQILDNSRHLIHTVNSQCFLLRLSTSKLY